MPTTTIIPVPGAEAIEAYSVPKPPYPIDLHLSGNEGATPPEALLEEVLHLDVQTLRRYPSAKALEALLAERMGVTPEQVMVTAGGDEALDRACRTMLAPGRTMILPTPTFVMLDKYARLARAEVVTCPWPSGPYPTEAVLEAVDESTAVLTVVSPNNPTGAVASAEDLRRLSKAAPQAMLIVDLAYVEFADVDLTRAALELPNAVVFRTLSKAWGIAGLRIGYTAGPAEVISWLRAAASPYSVSGISLALAAHHLNTNEHLVEAFIARVREERAALEAQLERLGARPLRSQGNFVFCRPTMDTLAFRDGLARHGIGVRAWPGHPLLDDAIRITCPGDPSDFTRLTDAIEALLRSTP